VLRSRGQNVPPTSTSAFARPNPFQEIPASPLELLAKWLDSEPEIPEGQGCKRFSDRMIGGEGRRIKTFLLTGQAAKGKQVS